MLAPILSALALACGTLHVRAEYSGNRRRVYLFKPLTVLCIIAVALVFPGPWGRYRIAILAGLLCSLAGDIFLMLPRDRFLAGVAAFLAAHVAYIVAFTAGMSLGARPALLLPWLAIGGTMLGLLWARLGKMRVPVTVYVAVIVLMAWQATTRAVTLGTTPALLAALGAALFVLSDGTLALNRFRRPFRAAQAIILPTYFAAQLLIAWSAR